MWAVGYVAFLPLAGVPAPVFLALMLACLVAGGWIIGRHTQRGIVGGACVGLIAATLDLLILGSLLLRPPGGQAMPSAWLWLPAVFALSAILAAAGALAGKVMPTAPDAGPPDWLAAFAWVACSAALLLIAVGGLVTGFRAGMAVPDWPGSFGFNMFLFPLAMMTGGVFYEHAHRLLGTLLGLSTLVLAIYVTATEVKGTGPCFRPTSLLPRDADWPKNGPVPTRPRKMLVAFLWLVGACVAVQGVLGGFRVTENSYTLAVIHGTFAHAVLGALVAAAVMLSVDWQRLLQCTHHAERDEPNLLQYGHDAPHDGFHHAERDEYDSRVGTTRLLCVLAVGLILSQTLLGVLLRQLNVLLLAHVSVAALVVLAALGLGIRAWGLNPQSEILRRGGAALMFVVVVQVTLGLIAVVFRTPSIDQSPDAAMLALSGGGLPVAPLPAVLTTAHQANAAIMLWLAVMLAVWLWPVRRPVSGIVASGP